MAILARDMVRKANRKEVETVVQAVQLQGSGKGFNGLD